MSIGTMNQAMETIVGEPPVADVSVTADQPISIAPSEEQPNWLRSFGLVERANSALLSAVLHLVIFIILAFFTIVEHFREVLVLDSTPITEAEEALEEFEFEPLDVADIEVADVDTIPVHDVQQIVEPDVSEVKLESEVAAIDISRDTVFDAVFSKSDELLSEIPPDTRGLIGKPGPALREATSESEAVDGIAAEILAKRREGDLLTVWLFDASISLRENRIKAAKRLGAVFAEIDERLEHNANESKNAVVAFGNACGVLVPPTPSNRNVTRAIRSIPEDPTGKENVLSSVGWSINQFREQWDGKMMIVVWTDESGDDLRQLEKTIAFCKTHDVTVSVIGPTAVLGFEMGTQAFFHKAARKNFFLPVNRGPEAALKQRVYMPRWSNVGWNNDQWLTEPISSGFAPYALMRLSRETGGSFTIYDRKADRGPFRLDMIRDYVPDYRSQGDIESELANFPLRQAVVAAVGESYRQPDRKPPRMTFFPIWMTPVDFRRQVSAALRTEAAYAESMAELADRSLKHLTAPGVEAAYESELARRWRAAHDLARGRLLRMSVRYREYANACRELKLRDTTNLLSFRPTAKLRTQSAGQRMEEANRFLQRCIEEHPDTPWSLLANNELRHGLGFTDSQRNQPQPNRSGGGGGKSFSLPNL